MVVTVGNGAFGNFSRSVLVGVYPSLDSVNSRMSICFFPTLLLLAESLCFKM